MFQSNMGYVNQFFLIIINLKETAKFNNREFIVLQ